MKPYNTERKRTLKIYWLLIAVVCLDAFLKAFISSTFIRLIELLCIVNILYLCYRLNGFIRLKTLGFPIMMLLLAIVSFLIILRGEWNLGIKDILLKFISPHGVWLYISPFVLLCLPNRKYFRDIIKIFFYASLITIPLWFLNANHLIERNLLISYRSESIGVFLPFFAGFLLSLSVFFSKKENLLIRIVWAVYLILMLLNARRNVSFSLVLYGMIAYFVYLKSKRGINKVGIICASFVVMCFFAIIFSDLSSGMFSRMTERAGEDTRSGVTEMFFLDFMKAPWEDWAFGRGMDGTYFQPVKNVETGEIVDGRPVIETGYLNLMLKGGIVYDIIIMIILLGGIYRSYKQRGNKVMAYICIFICTYLIDLYSTSPLMPYSVRSILFWFCISVVYTKIEHTDKVLL